MIQQLSSQHFPKPKGHYSTAVRHDGVLYLSGQLPIAVSGEIVEGRSFAEQAQLVLDNISLLLEEFGSSLEQVLKVTVFLSNIEDWPEFNRLYAAHFGVHKPARSVVPVGVLHYGFLLEVELVAAVD